MCNLTRNFITHRHFVKTAQWKHGEIIAFGWHDEVQNLQEHGKYVFKMLLGDEN